MVRRPPTPTLVRRRAATASQPNAPPPPPTDYPPHPVPPEVKSILFTETQIAAAVRRMGREISRDFGLLDGPGAGGEKELVVCGVLTGAFVFAADLARAIAPTRGLRVDFLRASSYGSGAESSGDVRVSGTGEGDEEEEARRWRGRRVVLVEDIIDSGQTLRRLADELARLGASEVRVAALLDKRGRRKAELRHIKADYVGFADCPDEFVVGYGLDYGEAFRTLPYIAALKEEVYAPAPARTPGSASP